MKRRCFRNHDFERDADDYALQLGSLPLRIRQLFMSSELLVGNLGEARATMKQNRVCACLRCASPRTRAQTARGPSEGSDAVRARVCAARWRELRTRGIRPEIARRNTEHGSGLGRYRWVVERTFAWLHQFKRLLSRYDRVGCVNPSVTLLGRIRG